MIVFFYDKTFEGLLTAIFDAYSRKVFPDKLLAEGDILPIFVDETYTVVTQEDRAARVWAALEKKMSRNACSSLTCAWLYDEAGADEIIFSYIRKMLNSKISIETNFGDEDVLRVNKMAHKVLKEQYYIKQFVRFQKAADDIFFATVSPTYNALPIAIPHFKDRFADQKWVIYDIKRHYGFYYDLHTAVEMTFDDDEHLLSGKLDEELMAQDEKLFQELWKGYFKSMTIKERINPKLHRQHMPRRFWKYLTEKQ
ncbi:TIGR03915 family putative DNA repair protein [Prevotella sp. 10(H)]|uniref:TIGR03915 family putative DNA repair protein n=1 Tax=Prevotella sp. 10(H) TaxID=1158294 RepID=UPI0004A6E14A|nr:TIGR03915 family putative DNA repair protein [Prevotella sp. 10(H)]